MSQQEQTTSGPVKTWAQFDQSTKNQIHQIIDRIEGMPSTQNEFRCSHDQAMTVLLALQALTATPSGPSA